MCAARTLYDKIWESHLVQEEEDGTSVLYIDGHLVHEVTSPQAFEGVCIARKSDGLNSAFTVRKISYGEGVERVFPLYSPRLESIDVVRRGKVRRAKLYYLRGRTGKRARIAERQDWARKPKGAAAPKVEAPVSKAEAPAPEVEAKADE